MSDHEPVHLPVQRDRSPDEEAALEASISRHPAGRRQRRPYRAAPLIGPDGREVVEAAQ